MPFHFCMDEVLMIMAMIPFIGVAFRRVHAWWHGKFNHQCHHVTKCEEHHLEHESKKIPGYITKENMDEEREKLSKYEF
jgi:hypothetical protein